ncbi:MAG: U32 family peptidase [Piscinibacter sp.]|nr:U32 family peptidase [Piscinibacter sp.]
MPRPELELLAPARDADIGIEAVNHGADAVYIGGPSFGARDKAGNELPDLERLVKHAHRYRARIFLTLNTILRDDELEAARRLAWDAWNLGIDALIVQDMGLLELDLPPIQLHASTQTDIRTPEKARFLQDAGFSQMVLARELTLAQIQAVAAQVGEATLEFFIHGALCVAYSGQCFISHAHTGRSANRGNCSQECRLPYTVTDAQGRIVAHEKHVLSLKDNDQSANLAALVEAGVRSFKIEGRYKDLGYVKNVTAHYRQLFDALLEGRRGLRRASSGRCRFHFAPDPARNFNRGATDYFVNGRLEDIGAFDTPKHAGLPLGHVTQVGRAHFELETEAQDAVLNNGDALTWVDLQGELQGVPVNVATRLAGRTWRVEPNAEMAALKDLRRGTAISRNRDMAWERLLARPSAERRIGVDLYWRAVEAGFVLEAVDEDGHHAAVAAARALEPARDPVRARSALHDALGKLGTTIFEARAITIAGDAFVPASLANGLRRDVIAALEAARAGALARLPRARPVEPPLPYPEDTLSYLANVHNGRAAAFYARHGVKVVAAAYESHEELGEVSLMITRHCVRYSLSLCPKQAKGVVGVQGTVRAEPLTLVSGGDRLTLRFDCKPCEMHVVGRMRKSVLKDAAAVPMQFYRTRPAKRAAAS